MALVAIEEVSKVCATSGLHPRGAGARLARAQARRHRRAEGRATCRGSRPASGSRAYALTEAGSGSDSAAMRTTARRDGDEYVLNGVEAVHHERRRREPLHRLREDRPRSRPRRHLGVRRRGGRARASRSPASSRRWGSRARRRASSSSTTAASRRRTCSARRARASGSRCASSTARGRASPRRALGIAQGATDYAARVREDARDDGQADRASTS